MTHHSESKKLDVRRGGWGAFMRSGKLVLLAGLAACIGAGVTLLLLQNEALRESVFGRRAGQPLPGNEGLVVRRALIAKRDAAAAAGELNVAAGVHGILSSEGVLRAKAVYDAWMPMRDPDSGLFPQSSEKLQWNYRNVAADFFCFQLHTGMYVGAEDVDLLFATLDREATLGRKGDLPLPRWVRGSGVIYQSTEHPWFGSRGPLFGASEYVKDGLLGLYEATGDERIYRRMLELVDAILAHSSQRSPFGAVPSQSSEVNGEMLQTLARVARVESDPRYSQFLGRIAEAAISTMFAANNGLPCDSFDYESEVAEDSEVPLRDHGNEIIPGLAEAFAFAADHSDDEVWGERASRWAEPLAVMFETIFRAGIREDGLLANSFDARSGELLDAGINDNWGYVAAGALLFADRASAGGLIAKGRVRAIQECIQRLSGEVTQTDRVRWEGAGHDGYADSIESAMLVAAHDPQAKAKLSPWIDDQIGVLFTMQKRDGFISRGYLDGNFMRTALMYADMRSGSWVLHPWDEAVAVGYSEGETGAVLHLRGKPGRTYTLRHRSVSQGFADVFSRPTPRLNSWPTWSDPAFLAASHEDVKESGVTIPDSGSMTLYQQPKTQGESKAPCDCVTATLQCFNALQVRR